MGRHHDKTWGRYESEWWPSGTKGENVRPWGFVGLEKVKASVDEQLGRDSVSLPLTLESGCYSWQSSVSFLVSAWVGEYQSSQHPR